MCYLFVIYLLTCVIIYLRIHCICMLVIVLNHFSYNKFDSYII